jgi:NADH:ubiquinone oxidoreductase subunit K
LIEAPTKAFRTIIFSEHKNFILFILFFVSIKYLINARFISMVSVGEFQSTIGLQLSYLIVLGITLSYFIIFSLIYKSLRKRNEINIRYKDTFALIIYSQIPFLFGLFILFPLELVILGDYLFSMNPTPFIIKGSITYFFLSIEIGLVIWSIFLVFKAFLTQSQHFLFSLISASVFVVLFWTLIYFCSLVVFTI